MKRFITISVTYFLIAVVLVAAIVIGFSNCYWDGRVPVMKEKIITKSSSHISVVLGSSHAFYGINSKLIAGNCYNMASISQGLYEDFFILKNISASRQVDFVILPVSYFSNNNPLENTITEGEYMRIFDYEHAYNTHYTKDSRYWKDRLMEYPAIAKAIVGHNDAKATLDEYGNLKEEYNSKQHSISDSVIAFERHNHHTDFSKRNPYLDSIITLCAQKNIKLNIVVFPFTSGYKNQVASSGTGFEPFLETIKSMRSGNYKFIDCRDLITENEQLYFRDADHLSPSGRDSLSSFLGQHILK